MINSFPYFFPIAILCVDDDKDVVMTTLHKFKKLLPGRKVVGVHSGEEALVSIKENPFQFSLASMRNKYKNCKLSGETGVGQCPDQTLDAIQNFASEFGIVVLDYDMKEMNGLDLASRVYCVGKILLTGEATQAQALNAFNAGIIDRFVQKDMFKATDVVAGYITSLEEDFFANINTEFAEMYGDDLRFLNQKNVCAKLTELCIELQAKLVGPSFDPPGLVIQSSKGDKIILMVVDEIDIEVQLSITEEDIDPLARKKMEDRKIIYYRKSDQPKLHSLRKADESNGVYHLTQLTPGFFTSVIRLIVGDAE